MRHFAISAIGKDRPGIVASITGELLDWGGNIEDTQMSILGGHFAVMMIASHRDDGEELVTDLESRMDRVREAVGLNAVTVDEITATDDRSGSATHSITFYGADHPGIVNAVSSAVADLDISITNLETRIAGEGQSIYLMSLEVDASGVADDRLEQTLKQVAERDGLELAIHELDDTPL